MKILAAFLVAMPLAACAPMAETYSALEAADPNAPHRRSSPSSVTAGTRDFQPVQPRPWTDANKSVAPQQEGAE